MRTRPEIRLLFLASAIVLAIAACGDDDTKETARFVFEMVGEGLDPQPFTAETSDPDVIQRVRADLVLPLQDRDRHINGPIDRGDGGHNQPWTWHFVPDQWDLVELSMELCDGNPTDVENDPDYWVDTVGVFCPWSARVVEEKGE